MKEGKEKRKHDVLRTMVNDACTGLLPSVQERIRVVARKAYYLGAHDGMELERNKEKRE